MSKNQNLLDAINKICDPHKLFLVDKTGKLRVLICPFPVKSLITAHHIINGKIYRVDAVKITDQLLMIYIVERVAYPYHFFILVI